MKKGRLLITLGLILLGLVAAVIAVSGSDSSSALSHMSAPGKVMPLAHGHGRATVLANRNGRIFFRRQSEGLTCYGRGKLNAAGAVLPGAEQCPLNSVFPSPKLPVLAAMSIEIRKSAPDTVTIRSLEGFAADGVVAVEFVREDGSLIASGDVRNNSFSLPVGGMHLNARRVLVARNEGGTVIYRETFGPRGVG